MKKVYALTMGLMMGMATSFAQTDNTFKFVTIDEELNETGSVEDNAVINVSTVSNVGGADCISSGLALKNTTDATAFAFMEYEITKMENGTHQICFSGACLVDKEEGEYIYPRAASNGNMTSKAIIKAGVAQSLQAEWLFKDYGTTAVTYHAQVAEKIGTTGGFIPQDLYGVKAEGPTVTVNYIHTEDTGISNNVTADEAKSVSFYDLSGRRVAADTKGMVIRKLTMRDGSVKTEKLLMK